MDLQKIIDRKMFLYWLCKHFKFVRLIILFIWVYKNPSPCAMCPDEVLNFYGEKAIKKMLKENKGKHNIMTEKGKINIIRPNLNLKKVFKDYKFFLFIANIICSNGSKKNIPL